jgi:hypothetical protein
LPEVGGREERGAAACDCGGDSRVRKKAREKIKPKRARRTKEKHREEEGKRFYIEGSKDTEVAGKRKENRTEEKSRNRRVGTEEKNGERWLRGNQNII